MITRTEVEKLGARHGVNQANAGVELLRQRHGSAQHGSLFRAAVHRH